MACFPGFGVPLVGFQSLSTEGATRRAIPDAKFYPKADARVLREAMKGFGTDERAIVSVLGYRSTAQMKQIEAEYNSEYQGHKTLQEKLEADLSGNLRDLCLLLLDTPAERDARLLRGAIKGLGTNEKALIGVICTQTNNKLREVIQAYKQMYGDNLLNDVVDDTSGYFQKLLTTCLKADRPEGGPVHEEAVKRDVDILLNIEHMKCSGTPPEDVFIDLLANRSHDHIKAVSRSYNGRFPSTIDAFLEGDSDVKTGLKTIASVVRDPVSYVSEEFDQAMQGHGTDDCALVRLVVTHCSTDMAQVKESFYRRYKVQLHSRIKDETSGEYQTLMLALLGEWRK